MEASHNLRRQVEWNRIPSFFIFFFIFHGNLQLASAVVAEKRNEKKKRSTDIVGFAKKKMADRGGATKGRKNGVTSY